MLYVKYILILKKEVGESQLGDPGSQEQTSLPGWILGKNTGEKLILALAPTCGLGHSSSVTVN